MSVEKTLQSNLLIAIPLSLVAFAYGVFDLNGQAQSPQIWDLTNNAGQVATVVVSPFTYSGTFGETESSAGWWINMPGCAPIRLQVGGNITHTTPGDHWTFVGLTGSGCNTQALGSGEGYANGNFPDATQVLNGTIKLSIQTPRGTNDTNGTWTGQKR